jgi:hypothetical protein
MTGSGYKRSNKRKTRFPFLPPTGHGKGVFASFLPRRFLGKIDPFVSIPNIAKPQSVAPGYQ